MGQEAGCDRRHTAGRYRGERSRVIVGTEGWQCLFTERAETMVPTCGFSSWDVEPLVDGETYC